MKIMAKKKENKNEANEPSENYGNQNILIFKSLEEENEYTHRQYAALTPEKRISIVTQMRLTAFPYLKDNLNPWGTIIFFD